MTNLIRQGQQLLAQTLKEHAADPVVYRRGGESVEIQAVAAMPNQSFGPEFGGTLIRGDRREILVTAADLVIGGETITPKIGDTFDIEDDDGVVRRFRVSIDGSLPEAEPGDAFGIMTRIRGAFQGVVT